MNWTVERIERAAAQELVVKHHYMHQPIAVDSRCYGLLHRGEYKGVITISNAPTKGIAISACPSNPKAVKSLSRMWIDDRFPRNTATQFISRVLKRTPAHIVVAYSETAVGHMGYVYRAANWNYAGWTEPGVNYTLVNGKHYRRQLGKHGHAQMRKQGKCIQRTTKLRYWTVTGNKRQRRNLRRLVKWPSLCWKANPPPVWTGPKPEYKRPRPKPQPAPLLEYL